MEAIPNASEEEAARVPAYLGELRFWLQAQGKSDNVVSQTVRVLSGLVSEDRKSIESMATSFAYFDLVKASPQNQAGKNRRSSALGHLRRWWEERPPGPPQDPGGAQVPAKNRSSKPEGEAGRSAKSKREKGKKEKAKKEKKGKKAKKEEAAKADRKRPLTSLNELAAFAEVSAEAAQLESGVLAEAVVLLGRDAGKKNASINGVYVRREGKKFHGRESFKKEGEEPRFLFFSSPKGAWKISSKLDDSKAGFAFAKVNDRGEAVPAEPQQTLVWRVCDGKEEGYNKDRAVRGVRGPRLLQGAGPQADGAESDMGSEPSSSCQQGSDPSSEEGLPRSQRAQQAVLEQGSSSGSDSGSSSSSGDSSDELQGEDA